MLFTEFFAEHGTRIGAVSHACSNNRVSDHFVSGQPLSLALKNALSPGTTASCL